MEGAETMKYRVLVLRTEVAEVEIDAESDKDARAKVKDLIETADCIADLDFDWDQDGGITIESLPPLYHPAVAEGLSESEAP